MLQRIVSSPWFALADLLLVIFIGLLWTFQPEFGFLPTVAIAFIPSVIRLSAGSLPFRKTPFDWLVAVFLATAWVGYWAAYDKEAAWSKIWFIVLSMLLYYALAAQPKQNFGWVCVLLFCTGFGIATYFFLTHDFVALPRKVEIVNRFGRWVMETIPRFGWTPIHPNYVAGIAAITTPFILFPAGKLIKRRTPFSSFVFIVIIVGFGVVLSAILMATSRGIMMAIACAFGSWILWRILPLNGSRLWFRREALFPPLILIFLGAVVLFLYLGPASAGNVVSENQPYGTGSRGELAARSIYLLSDFPFTGGGLDAFPGLYSQYILGIPSLYVINSHNLFLDVAIEQGLLGGISFLLIFLLSIWFTARVIAKTDSLQVRGLGWLTLFALIIAFVHGMVDDYLYNGSGTFLSLGLAGFSSALQPETVRLIHRKNYHIAGFVSLVLITAFMINGSKLRSAWHADLGAVQMSRMELAGFPTNTWIDSTILPDLETAEISLHSALKFDPTNRTANHRLGLIYMLRQEFDYACSHLESAHKEAPGHRGIVKSLGYCYVWLGEMEKAQVLLAQIQEAKRELKVYVWWWETQDRADLSQRASLMVSMFEN